MTTPAGAAPLIAPEGNPLLILIDGHALVHRAYHAQSRDPLTVQRTGEIISGVYGFMNIFLRAIAEWQPTHCIITFDLPQPTFRHEILPEYKAHRPPTPPELRSQFGWVRQFMDAFAVPIFELAGYEADDLLGTLAAQAEQERLDTLILTGDSDILQLVSPSVRVLLDSGRTRARAYDIARVQDRYDGLGPEYVADIKALEGDKSDNIPGVPSIGKKTAVRLLAEYGSVEGIYERIDEVGALKIRGAKKIQQTLTDNHDIALQCKTLTTIKRDVPITLDLNAARFGGFKRPELLALMRDLEFNSMLNRIPADNHAVGADAGRQISMLGSDDAPADGDNPSVEYIVVDTEEALDAMLRELETAEIVAFDTETTSQSAMLADLVGLSFSNEAGKAWYLPVGHDEGRQISMEHALNRLRPLLESGTASGTESAMKSGVESGADSVQASGKPALAAHNANYDMTTLANHGVHMQKIGFDTMIAAHLCGRTRTAVGLKSLALDLLNEEMTPIEDIIGKGRNQITMAQAEIAKAADYAAADADMTRRLADSLTHELAASNLRRTFDDLEMPLVPVLVKMQRHGVAVNSDALNAMSAELGAQIDDIRTRMYETVGHEFNINSPKQLGGILFDELHLRPATPKRSTNAAALDTIKDRLHNGIAGERGGMDVDPKAEQVLDMILDYRQLAKLKSTYVDALPTLVNPRTGRIHTEFKQTGSDTGRLSSAEPNLQNIPIRTEIGRQVRRAFVAEHAPEWTLLGADYSQIELRILAHYSRDESLIAAFQNGEDIHAATAASLYNVPIDAVDGEMRRVAKIMNFGVVYGLGPQGIQRQTGFSREEGSEFIEAYKEKYPGIQSYLENTKYLAEMNGYVETLTGRRRSIPELQSANGRQRAAGERMAVNMPIQGTAADIIKIAMIRIQRQIEALGLRSKMILQVHDELIFEAPRAELPQMQAIITELMSSAVPPNAQFAVPLEVDLKAGDNWGDMAGVGAMG